MNQSDSKPHEKPFEIPKKYSYWQQFPAYIKSYELIDLTPSTEQIDFDHLGEQSDLEKLKNLKTDKTPSVSLYNILEHELPSLYTSPSSLYKYSINNYLNPSKEEDSYPLNFENNEECFTVRFNETSSQIASGYISGRIGIFNWIEQKSFFVTLTDFPITCLRWKPHSRSILWSVSADGYIYQTHTTSGKPWHKIEEKGNSIWCVDYNLDGTLFATGGNNKVINLYDDNTKTIIKELKNTNSKWCGHSNRIFSTKFSSENSNLLVSGGWDNLLVWYDIREKKISNTLYGPHLCGDGIDIKNNIMLTTNWENREQITFWDLRMMKSIKVFECWRNGKNPVHQDNKTEKNTDESYSFLYSCRFNNRKNIFAVTGSNSNWMRIYRYDESLNNIEIEYESAKMDLPCYCCDFCYDTSSMAYSGGDSLVRVVNINKK